MDRKKAGKYLNEKLLVSRTLEEMAEFHGWKYISTNVFYF